MNNERSEIRAALDKQYRKDLNKILQTDYGRRFFSYLLMDCGLRESMPQGNSKDIFNAGRRAVAVGLTFAADSIDWPHRTSGAELRLKAEKEYINFQLSIKDEIDRKRKEAMARRTTPNGL